MSEMIGGEAGAGAHEPLPDTNHDLGISVFIRGYAFFYYLPVRSRSFMNRLGYWLAM